MSIIILAIGYLEKKPPVAGGHIGDFRLFSRLAGPQPLGVCIADIKIETDFQFVFFRKRRTFL